MAAITGHCCLGCDGKHLKPTDCRPVEHRAAALYDAAVDRITIELTSGATHSFAAWLAKGLRGMSAADLDVKVPGVGFGRRWERLDVDYTVAGLLNGVFGTRAWLDELRVAEAAE